MKRIFLLSLILAFSWGIKAQQTVSGKVLNAKTQEPVGFADVLLFRSQDSTFVQQTMTKEDGSYQIEKVSHGNFFLRAKMLGYKESSSKDFRVVDSPVKIALQMEEDSKLLNEVVITEKKQFVEQQADKMIINPEANITTASDNVLDVLSKSPGVVVDKDGNIMLKGKSGITVLIDDKPTYLTTAQLATTLRNLQASSVDKIEIMENPPAKYDAEGSSGVINIRTKRGKIKGWNGSVLISPQMNKEGELHGSLDLNYRNEKMNIYGNYLSGFNYNWHDVDLVRKFPEGDGSTFLEYSEGDGHSPYTGLKLGMDYYFNKDHIIGIMGRGFGWNWKGGSHTQTNILNAAGILQSHEDTNNDETEEGSEWTVNLNYRWNMDSLGRSLSADLDYAYYTYGSTSDMRTTYVPVKDPLIIKNAQHSYTNIYSFKVDYTHPLSEKTQVDAGLKTSLVNIDSNLAYEQLDTSREMSNRFKYTENINALYASFKHKWNDSWDMQLGLRGEQTYSKGNNVTIDSVTERNYLNLFPTVFLQRKFTDKHQINMSYAYRIGRPNYWLLNPFIWMLNPYTYNQGNPLLEPQFTHSIKLGYTFNQKYILSLGYAYTKDQYTQVFEQNDQTKITVVTWRNLNSTNNADLTLVIPVQIKKWFQANANMTAYYIEYKLPQENGSSINRSKVTFRGNLFTTFSLPKAWSLELSGWYMSNSIYGTMDFKPQGSVDVGAQKLLLNDKLSIKLSLKDLFATQRSYYTSTYQNLDLRGIQHYNSREVQLTLAWRFGKDDIKPARQRSTGLEEEAGRAGK